MKISLVLLTKNEIEGVRTLVPRLPKNAVDEIIAVDGGSTDGTREFLSSQGIRVTEEISKGRGAAFFIAFREAQGEALIFFSPDGNEDPLDIPGFKPLLEAGADIVIASRMMKGAHNEEDESWFPIRKIANNIFNWIANIIWNRSTYVSDTINGYRALRKQTFQQLHLDAQDFTIEYQMSIRSFKHQLSITEFPTHEGARIGGTVHAQSVPTGLRFLWCILRELVL